MVIINALKAKKLNSQITCTSYYDFLPEERRCLEAFNFMGMQRGPSATKMEDPLGSVMDISKRYDVVDNATEWYLGTRALPVKNPRICQCKFSSKDHPLRHARQRRLKATAYPVPGGRVSPEFLKLLKQHHDRTQGHLHRKSRRPKTSFSYYKYDKEGKRRHMRPGIDTAAPLEFPSPMEMDRPDYRKRLSREQEKAIDPSVSLGSEEDPHGHYPLPLRSKRIKNHGVRHTRSNGNQNMNINAKDIKWFEEGLLGFPSEEARGNIYLETSRSDLDNRGSVQENIETGANNYPLQTNNPSVPDPPHLHDEASVRSESNCNLCTSDSNNNMEMVCPYQKKVLDDSVLKNHTVNRSQKTNVTDKPRRGILRKRPSSKASALDSGFRKIKKVCIASCAEFEQEKPNYSGNIPDNSESPLTARCTSCTQTVTEPIACNCLKTNQSMWANPPNIRNVALKEYQNHLELNQEKSCQCSSKEDLIERNSNGSKVNPEIKGQKKSKQVGKKTEKPNSSGKSPYNSEVSLTCQGTSFTPSVVKPSSYTKTKQLKWKNTPNSSNKEKPKTRNASQSSEAEQQEPPKKGHKWFFCQKRTSKKQQTETNAYGSKVKTKIMGQESRLSVRHSENPNFGGNNPDNSGRPLCCKGSSSTRTVAEPSSVYYLKTKQSKLSHPSNCRKVTRPSTRVVAEPSYGCHLKTNQSKKKIQDNSCNCRTVRKLRVTQNLDSNRNKKRCPPVTKRHNKQLRKCGTNSPRHTKASSKERSCSPEAHCNLRRWPTKRIPIRCDPTTKKCVLFPHSSGNEKTDFNNEQLRKCRTNSPRHTKASSKERSCSPEAHCNGKRWPTKPLPIRCDPITKKCVPFPHSSGNERTDLKRWLYPRSSSGSRVKKYTKTRKTIGKGCRATRKCHQSDSSSSCEQNPCRVRLQQRPRGESCCRCPCCSSMFPARCSRSQEVQFPSASRSQENYQRFCPHSKRWHCKPGCQENSQESCEQTCYAPVVSRYWGSCRMRGGVDLREDDDFIPGRNRGVPHSCSSSLSSDSDSKRQVKYSKPRKWSVHAFCFD